VTREMIHLEINELGRFDVAATDRQLGRSC
jgi:hypothetical protein